MRNIIFTMNKYCKSLCNSIKALLVGVWNSCIQCGVNAHCFVQQLVGAWNSRIQCGVDAHCFVQQLVGARCFVQRRKNMRFYMLGTCTIATVLFSIIFIPALGNHVPTALADNASDIALSQAQDEVTQTAATYADYSSRVEQLELEIEDTQRTISDIETKLPAQKRASNSALVSLYKMYEESSSLLDMVLSATNITELLENLDYLNRLQQGNASKVQQLSNMQQELYDNNKRLRDDLCTVEQQREQAEKALVKAQDARAVAQAEAEAKKRAEDEAAVAAAAIAADANNGSTVADGPSDGGIDHHPSDDHADWSSDKSQFVQEWGGRINSYLAGSPMAGLGGVYAEAAWNYGVDPRWSPAISCVESTKGRYCFRPHNAWGWGSSSWDSWEEAIDCHVRGLHNGYGYTLTLEAARKYCPPNWEFWYNRCAEEMEKI